jgi:hypothetical protein
MVLVCCLLGAQAYAGAGSSGGGFVCDLTDGTEVLLDLIEYNPGFKDTYTFSKTQPLKFGRVGKKLGYEKRDVKSFPAYDFAMQKLKTWEASSPTIIKMIEQALPNVDWRFSEFKVTTGNETFVASDETRKVCTKIRPAILYTQQFGALVSGADWIAGGDSTQAGWIIHEALRYVQLNYSSDLSTEKLQKLTATILLEDPSKIETLETADYLDGKILDQAKQKIATAKEIKSVMARICAVFEKDLPEISNIKDKEIQDLENQGQPFEAEKNRKENKADVDKLKSFIAKSCSPNSPVPSIEDFLAAQKLAFNLVWNYPNGSKSGKEMEDAGQGAGDECRTLCQIGFSENTFAFIDAMRGLSMNHIITGIGEDEMIALIDHKSDIPFWHFILRHKMWKTIRFVHKGLENLYQHENVSDL